MVSLVECLPSSSVRVLAQPYWNCSHVSNTPRPGFAGFARTGAEDFSDDAGSGSTPLNGALSMETVTDAALAGDLLGDESAERVADDCRGAIEGGDGLEVWSVTCCTIIFAKASGCSRASATVAGSSGQPGARVVYPLSSNRSRHGCQLLESSQRPCTNSTGVLSVEFARSISARSQSASVELGSAISFAILWVAASPDVGHSVGAPGLRSTATAAVTTAALSIAESPA